MNDIINPGGEQYACEKTAEECSSGVLADLQRNQRKLELRLKAVQEAIKALQDHPEISDVLEKINTARRLG